MASLSADLVVFMVNVVSVEHTDIQLPELLRAANQQQPAYPAFTSQKMKCIHLYIFGSHLSTHIYSNEHMLLYYHLAFNFFFIP